MSPPSVTDLIDEIHQIWVCRWIVQIVAALGLLVTSATDAAETGDASRTFHMNVLILGVLAHP